MTRANDRSTAELIAAFRARRLELVRRLEALTAEEARLASEHPRLRFVDWLYLLVEDDDHHLAKRARSCARAAGGQRR